MLGIRHALPSMETQRRLSDDEELQRQRPRQLLDRQGEGKDFDRRGRYPG
jgi:hypothetical protein